MTMKKTPPKEANCVCEDTGHFSSGVPGILAHIKNGRIVGRVERCDTCQRFRDDQVAESVLQRLLERRAPQPRGRPQISHPRRR